MSAAPPLSSERLARAFERFESAATRLESRYAALEDEAKRLERELLDAHRHLEAVLDAMEGGVAVVSDAGTIVRTNRAMARLGLVRTGERPLHPVLAELACAPPGRGSAARLEHQGPDGRLDLAATIVPVGDARGSRVLTVQDVTEIRREEREGGRRRRLEALGRMAAEVAHEVRNPLGSIRLFASMLHEDLAGEPPLREMADQILAASAALETTVSNLLAFASPPRGARAEIDLAALASDVCALFAPSCAQRGVELTGPAPADGCRIGAEPEGMRQVLLNLLGNALAATPGGGAIRVGVRREGDRAVMEVADSGHGIAAEDLPRVFDPFFSRTEGGTGLGLSIVHGIVERHGGRIVLDSRPGAGTVARAEIPFPEEKPHA